MNDKTRIPLTRTELRLILDSLSASMARVETSMNYSTLPSTIERKGKEIDDHQNLINKISFYMARVIRTLMFKPAWYEDNIGRIVDPDVRTNN